MAGKRRVEEKTGIAEAMSARRIAIIDAADSLLGEAGLEGLTIRAVLALTGLSRRAFYDCFATKDDLMLALFAHTLNRAAERLGQDGEAGLAPAGRLAMVIGSIASSEPFLPASQAQKADRRGAAFSREHLRLAQTRPGELEAALQPLIRLLQSIIEDGTESGCWHTDDPSQMARFIYNLVSSTVHGELLQPDDHRLDPGDRSLLAQRLTRFCTNALRGDRLEEG